MSRRARCDSKWNKIIIFDEKGQRKEEFELNKLGQLKNKIKTQTRRKIHEGRQTRRINNQANTSITKGTSETNLNLNSNSFLNLNSNSNPNSYLNIQSQPFGMDVFQDQDCSMFEVVEEFSTNENYFSDLFFMNDNYNYNNIDNNEYDFFNISF